jgi:hypothetical protein
MLIFKRKTMTDVKIPQGIVVHIQEKGFMDESGMRLWLKKVWAKHPGDL